MVEQKTVKRRTSFDMSFHGSRSAYSDESEPFIYFLYHIVSPELVKSSSRVKNMGTEPVIGSCKILLPIRLAIFECVP